MDALIVVDIQNDFLPGGALAVPDGDAVIGVANGLVERFDLVIATQDWHPAGHKSFASSHPGCEVGQQIQLNGLEQILWPDHCVQGSQGAEFAGELNSDQFNKVFQKGADPQIDSYSGFFDNGHLKSTGLADFLKQQGVVHCFVIGLATDYCVKFTALDAKQLGFETTVIKSACRAVNLSPTDEEHSLAEMQQAGVNILQEI